MKPHLAAVLFLHGYELQHKYSRVSYTAMKNYYTLLQIAHVINQLTEKSREVVELLKIHSKRTVKHLWKLMTDALIWCVVITENALLSFALWCAYSYQFVYIFTPVGMRLYKLLSLNR